MPPAKTAPRTVVASRPAARFSLADLRYMRQALALAERGRGKTRPNPVVGAVIVRRGRVLARGYHHRAGEAHAEVDALAKLGFQAPGATLYVTMEPCCHQGRTGPCTEAIKRAGVARVVVGCCDENPLVSGRGVLELRAAGIRVDVGCLGEESHAQNRAFFRWIRSRRPWVTLKVASTLDGFIGDPQNRRREPSARLITGPQARDHAHQLRAEHDAVLVGVGTVLADDPLLTVRRAKAPSLPCPLRVVLDGNLRTPASAKLFAQKGASDVLVIGVERKKKLPSLAARANALSKAGAKVVLLPGDKGGHVSIPALLRTLGEQGVQSLLVEGGAKVHASFIASGQVDSVAFFFAPRLVGGGVPIVEGPSSARRAPIQLGPLSVRAFGDDLLVVAEVLPASQSVRSEK